MGLYRGSMYSKWLGQEVDVTELSRVVFGPLAKSRVGGHSTILGRTWNFKGISLAISYTILNTVTSRKKVANAGSIP